MPGVFDEDDEMNFDQMCDLEADVLPELLPEYLSCGAFQSPPREQEESSAAMLVSLDGFTAGGCFSDEGEHASVAQDPYSVGVDDDDFQAFSLALPYSDTPSRGGVEEPEQATPDSSTSIFIRNMFVVTFTIFANHCCFFGCQRP